MSGEHRQSRGMLFVVPWGLDAVGGVVQVVANLILAAQRSGAFQPVLLVNDWNALAPTVENKQGLVTIRLRMPSPASKPRPIRGLLSFVRRLPDRLRYLHRILQQHHIATVNVHYPTTAALHFVILRMLRLYRGSMIVSVHGMDLRDSSTNFLERFLWRSMLRRADRVVACSNALAREVVASDAKSGRRVVAIHNGIDAESLQAERDRDFSVSELDGVPYILSVGTFERKKGHDVLLDAFRLLGAEFPRMHLVFVGRSAGCTEQLRRQADSSGLGKRVWLFKDVPHSRIHAFYQGAEVFCLPSRAEPFGIVLLEAALFGVPIVASNVGGVAEIVQDRVHGRLVPPDDPVDLASALRELLQDRALRERYSDALGRRVREEFSWDKAFAKYAALLR